MVQLREQVAEADEKHLKLSRKQLENFLEQEKRITLGSSITKFVIDAEASDEERGTLKREQYIEEWCGPERKELQSGRPTRN
jgi:hypothetical protein